MRSSEERSTMMFTETTVDGSGFELVLPTPAVMNMEDVLTLSAEHEYTTVCPEDLATQDEELSFLTDTEWSQIKDLSSPISTGCSDGTFYSADSSWSTRCELAIVGDEKPKAFMRNRADPARTGSFRELQERVENMGQVPSFWVAFHLTFTSFFQFERTLGQIECPKGYSCVIYPLLEEATDEWFVTFIVGVVKRADVEDVGLSVEQTLNMVAPFVHDSEQCTFEFAELIPWSEYCEWVGKRKVAFDSSIYASVIGDDMAVVESRCYREVQAQMG
jgi:hypothetical protein